MNGGFTISSEAVVALSRAIDAALECGDTDEAMRLASLQETDLDCWLQAHDYPQLRERDADTAVDRASDDSQAHRGRHGRS
jgi:hypothetical protein